MAQLFMVGGAAWGRGSARFTLCALGRTTRTRVDFFPAHGPDADLNGPADHDPAGPCLMHPKERALVSLNRVVMQPASRRMINALGPKDLDAAEISGKWGRRFDFKTYAQFRYPEYDVCADPFTDDGGTPLQFDLILANQVWEHLDRPYAATRNVHAMLRPGGYFWIAVPFFVPLHAAPQDNSRWSARGLKNLLIEGGFDADAIHSEQWGNRHVALRNLDPDWPPAYDADTDDIKNDPQMPICAWALAQKV